MHSPAARALLQPRALLHHPRVCTLKDLILAGHVITITYNYYVQCGRPTRAIIASYYVAVPYLSGAALTDITTGNKGKPAQRKGSTPCLQLYNHALSVSGKWLSYPNLGA